MIKETNSPLCFFKSPAQCMLGAVYVRFRILLSSEESLWSEMNFARKSHLCWNFVDFWNHVQTWKRWTIFSSINCTPFIDPVDHENIIQNKIIQWTSPTTNRRNLRKRTKIRRARENNWIYVAHSVGWILPRDVEEKKKS